MTWKSFDNRYRGCSVDDRSLGASVVVKGMTLTKGTNTALFQGEFL